MVDKPKKTIKSKNIYKATSLYKIFMSNEDLTEKNIETFKLIWNNLN